MARARRGRGEGHIEELPSGKWRGVLAGGKDPATGKRRKLTFTADTKREAQAWLRERQHEQNRGTLAHSGQTTVGEWLDRWLESCRQNVSEGTAMMYEQHCRIHIKPHLGTLRLDQLTPHAVQGFYSRISKADPPVSSAMVRKIATTLRTVCKAAVEAGLLAINPAGRVKKPRSERTTFDVWSIDEIRRFMQVVADDPYFALFALAIDSGARQGEIAALRWPCVDWQQSAIRIERTLYNRSGKLYEKDVKTKASRRRIRLTPKTMQALFVHLENERAAGRDVTRGLVFQGLSGGYLTKSAMISRFKRYTRKAGLKRIRFHDLRHCCATVMLSQGINVKSVQTRLGHTTAQITLDVYAHYVPEMEDQAIEVLSGALFPDCPTGVPQDSNQKS